MILQMKNQVMHPSTSPVATRGHQISKVAWYRIVTSSWPSGYLEASIILCVLFALDNYVIAEYSDEMCILSEIF